MEAIAFTMSKITAPKEAAAKGGFEAMYADGALVSQHQDRYN